MVVVAISMNDNLYYRIELLRDSHHNGKAVLFKRSPFYVALLEEGIKVIEERRRALQMMKEQS